MLRSLALALVAPALALGATAQGGDKVALTARFVPASASPGQKVTLELKASVEPGWHLYGKLETTGTPPTLQLEAHKLKTSGEFVVPPGELHATGGFEQYWLMGDVVFKQVFQVPAGSAGTLTVKGKFNYMVCNESFCLPPVDAPFKADLKVVAGAKKPASELIDPVGKGAGQGAGQGNVAGKTAGKTSGKRAGKTSGKKTAENVSQDPAAVHKGQHATVRAVMVPAVARPGEVVMLELRADVDPKYHMYGAMQDPETGGLPTIQLQSDALEALGVLDLPPGEMHEVEHAGIYYYLEGKFVARQALRVPKDARPGQIKLPFRLDYQICDDLGCVDDGDDLTATLTIEAGEVRKEFSGVANRGTTDKNDKTAGPGNGKEEGSQGPKKGMREVGLWEFILLAIGAGLFALMMPCTYPMIPITMSYFTKQAENRGGNVLSLALTYGAGIVVIFILMALVAGPIVVQFAQNPWVNLALAALFIYFGLALLGLIDIKPPKFLMDATAGASTKGGYVGVFLMGMTLVIATFACTVPFVGPLLMAGGQGGDLGRVILGMGVFGLTMALPFMALAILPGKLQAMPRAGQWMNTLKVVFGFVELAAALKFISTTDMVLNWQILPRELFLVIWFGIFLIAGVYLLGMIKLKGETGEIGAGRLLWGILVLLLALYFGHGAMGYKLDNWIMYAFEPDYSSQRVEGGWGGTEGQGSENGDAHSGDKHTVVLDDYGAAVAKAKAGQMKVLVNFTGKS